MRVFLRAGHLDAPHFFPGVVELHVNRVDARVVWRHSVAHVGGNSMFLKNITGRKVKGHKRLLIISLISPLLQTAAGFLITFANLSEYLPN